MSPLSLRLGGLALALVVIAPGPAFSQDDRDPASSAGKRILLEQIERERQQRQRWDAEEEDSRRRAKLRQRQREDYMQQHRQGELVPAPEPTP